MGLGLMAMSAMPAGVPSVNAPEAIPPAQAGEFARERERAE